MIQLHEVHKTYPKQINTSPAHHALKGVSFSLGQGQTLGLIGQNGAGKSTSIRLIMGYMQADKGRVVVLGEENNTPALRRHIGYLPETSSFPPSLTCLELLHFSGRCCNLSGKLIADRSEALLKRLGIWNARKRRLSEYSKGMQQRASFAAALIHDPGLLILDEPMSGLDPIGRAEIIELIHKLRSDGKSILFCSHLLDDVERITDHVAVLHQGNLLYNGAIDDLCSDQSAWSIDLHNGETISVDQAEQLPSLLCSNADRIVEVRRARESLQEAFVRVIQKFQP
jgi:ABC-2 type transport system ATP-binding protein